MLILIKILLIQLGNFLDLFCENISNNSYSSSCIYVTGLAASISKNKLKNCRSFTNNGGGIELAASSSYATIKSNFLSNFYGNVDSLPAGESQSVSWYGMIILSKTNRN